MLSRRVLRGGSWFDYPGFLRSTYRLRDDADFRDPYIGFRVAKEKASTKRRVLRGGSWVSAPGGLHRIGLSVDFRNGIRGFRVTKEKAAEHRVLRGGSWNNGRKILRSANRNWFNAGDRNGSRGFRVAKEKKDA